MVWTTLRKKKVCWSRPKREMTLFSGLACFLGTAGKATMAWEAACDRGCCSPIHTPSVLFIQFSLWQPVSSLVYVATILIKQKISYISLCFAIDKLPSNLNGKTIAKGTRPRHSTLASLRLCGSWKIGIL
jgi:hypothetical protein